MFTGMRPGGLRTIVAFFAAAAVLLFVRGLNCAPAFFTTTTATTTTTTTTTSSSFPIAYAFLHIGKAGGTTVDSAMAGARVAYVGHRHFDWSWLQLHHPHHRVLLVLRDPVDRAISQFYYSRKLPWTAGMAIRRQSLEDYLCDYPEMLATRGVWQDGEAGASWIAGTHIAAWVHKDTRVTIDERETKERNTARMCSAIESRLRRAFWVGFTDTLASDLRRLGARLGVSLKAGTRNANPHPRPSPSVVAKLKALTTLDHWLYSNAKKLASNPLHVFTPCPRDHPCRSTRHSLNCTASSPFGYVAHHD